MQSVNYLKNKFLSSKTHDITVLFDDYDDPDSVKKSQQIHRYRDNNQLFQISASIRFVAMKIFFLSNDQKKQLIIMLCTILENNNVGVSQSGEICANCLDKSRSQQVLATIVTQDIADPGNPNYHYCTWEAYIFLKIKIKACEEKSVSSHFITKSTHGMKTYNLLEYAFTGCDTTSDTPSKRKKAIYEVDS